MEEINEEPCIVEEIIKCIDETIDTRASTIKVLDGIKREHYGDSFAFIELKDYDVAIPASDVMKSMERSIQLYSDTLDDCYNELTIISEETIGLVE